MKNLLSRLQGQVFLFLLPHLIFSQDITVGGKIIDKYASPIAGAVISVKRSAMRVKTGADGAFKLNSSANDTLCFNLLGYKSVIMKAADVGSGAQIKMESEALNLFSRPRTIAFAGRAADKTNKKELIIGVALNGAAKAYPLNSIGKHHQVLDTVGNEPIIVTYCTVSKTSRVYSDIVNGKEEKFRLAGIANLNAVLEDEDTKSRWQQASGIAITGKLKGARLMEIPSAQMDLGDWLKLHPENLTMLPDSDKDPFESNLPKPDKASWDSNSWVVGVRMNGLSKAYDWNELLGQKMIQDSVAGASLLICADAGLKTFFVLNRNIKGQNLTFIYNKKTALLHDKQSNSTWQINGYCIAGRWKGSRMAQVQSYQEFWQAWHRFNPKTEVYQ